MLYNLYYSGQNNNLKVRVDLNREGGSTSFPYIGLQLGRGT
jgi:hypothetical protein